MGDMNSEEGPAKSNVVAGKGFVMENSKIKHIPSKETSVEMRTGASNEDAIRRLYKLREKFEKMSPEEKAQEWERREVESAIGWFATRLKEKDEYSETLGIKPDGKFDLKKRSGSDEFPYIPMHEVFSPNDLYEFMQKVKASNPDLNIQFENDPNGQWIRYIVKNNPK